MTRKHAFLRIGITLIAVVFEFSRARADTLSPDFLRRLETYSDFTQLNARTSYGSAFQVEWVKFMYLPKEGEAYFQQSHRYKLHHDFASKHLDLFRGMDEVRFKNSTQYKTNRLAFVGSFLHFPSDSKSSWGIQIISQDPMDLEEIKTVFDRILEAAPFLRELHSENETYLIPTNEQKSDFKSKEAELLKRKIRLRFFETFFATESLQCYSEGWAAGGLARSTSKTIDEEFRKGTVKEDHIVITNEVLAEMPAVAGLISETVSVPSSHTALLFEQERKPFLYLADKKELTSLMDQVGKPFFLETNFRYGGCTYHHANEKNGLTAAWINHLQDIRSVKVSKHPEKNIVTRKVKVAGSFGRNDTKTYGAKAANFSEMAIILGSQTVPTGAAIPFYYFEKFLDLKANEMPLRQLVMDIVNRHLPPRDIETLEKELENLRNIMIQVELPEPFLKEIQNQIIKVHPDPARMLFLRSSTNAEDGEEFNGAGLYDSKAGRFADEGGGKKPFSMALKRVWASLYKLNVFLALHRFGIPLEKVAMGVLVNPFFNPLEANGVAVVKRNGVIQITSQSGAEAVTNPNPGIRPEIVDMNPVQGGGYSVSVHQTSSLLPAGWQVLKDPQYNQLVQWIALVRKAYDKYTDLELNLEWLKSGGKLYLTQVRSIPDMLRRSKMKDLPLFVFGGARFHLKTCYGEGASAFDVLRSKITLGGNFSARYFDKKLEKNDYWTDVIIQIGGREKDLFSYPAVKKIPGIQSEFRLDREERFQDAETQGWFNQRMESLNSFFSVSSSPKLHVQEARTSERLEETGLLIEPFAFMESPETRRIFESRFFITLEHDGPSVGQPHGEGLETIRIAATALAAEDADDLKEEFLQFSPAKQFLPQKIVPQRKERPLSPFVERQLRDYVRVRAEMRAADNTPVVDNFYLCRYFTEEGLFADPDLIPSNSEFLSGTYQIRMKHLISDLHKQPYLKTYNSVPQEVTFEGVIAEPFTLKSWWAMVYTAHHHNFYEEFLFDLEKDETLDPIILEKLRQKKLRWIHLYRGMSDETGTRNFKLAGISPLGERTELGALKPKNFPWVSEQN